MYAIRQFAVHGVIPPKETLITLLEAEEAHRIKKAVKFDKVCSQLRYYKGLLVLLSLLVVVASGYSIYNSLLVKF